MTTDRCTTGSGEWTPPCQLLALAAEDEMLLPDLVRAFQEHTTHLLERIRSAAAAGEMERLRSDAHLLKGGASQLGAAAVADMCLEIEQNGSNFSSSELAECMGALESRFGETCYAMSRYLACPSRVSG